MDVLFVVSWVGTGVKVSLTAPVLLGEMSYHSGQLLWRDSWMWRTSPKKTGCTNLFPTAKTKNKASYLKRKGFLEPTV